MSQTQWTGYFLFVLVVCPVCPSATDTVSNEKNVTQTGILAYLTDMRTELNEQFKSLEKNVDRSNNRVASMEHKLNGFNGLIASSNSEEDNTTFGISTLYSETNTSDNTDMTAFSMTIWKRFKSYIAELKSASTREHENLIKEFRKKEKSTTNVDSDDNSNCNSHMGKEYIVMFPASQGSVQTVQLMISTMDDAVVTLESPFPGVNRTVSVSADHGAVVNLPPGIVQHGNSIELKGVLLRSSSDMFVSGIVQTSTNKGDAYGAIPVKNLGTSYIYAGYMYSFLSIVALHDDTRIDISIRDHSPQTYSDRSYSNGDTIKIYLSRLSTFQLFGNNYLLNIKIDSSKKIGVVSGSTCYSMNYNSNSNSYCNTYASYLPPTNSMGRSFIFPQVPLANYTYPFIYSEYGKSASFDIQAWSYRYSSTYNGYKDLGYRRSRVPYSVKSTVPALLTQVTTLYNSITYPSQTLIPALSQFSNNYRFITPTTRSFNSYATIIIKADDISGLRVDGKTIYTLKSDVKAIAQDILDWYPMYNVISLNITSGQHDVRHIDDDVRFGLIVQGFTTSQSYGFPAGLRLGTSENCTIEDK